MNEYNSISDKYTKESLKHIESLGENIKNWWNLVKFNY